MDREDAINYLLKIENELPVYDWKYGDIQLWPYLKVRLFFEVFKENVKGFAKEENKLPPMVTRICDAFFEVSKSKKKIRNKKIIFCGNPVYRSLFNNIHVNKFFKPLEKENSEFLYIEQGVKKPFAIYNEEIIESYKLLDFYKLKAKISGSKFILRCDGWDKIKEIAPYYTTAAQKLKAELPNICKDFLVTTNAYEKLLINSSIDKMFGLCYYSMEMSCVHYICNKLGIENIDMQHGGTGSLHPAYTFNNFPIAGVNTLPGKFYVWDEVSEKHLQTWLPANSRHEVEVSGNPWLNYVIEQSQENINENRKIILYTLQFSDIDAYIIDAIKLSTEDYIWWIRLHPRMMNEKGKIINQLLENNVLNRVNIDDATSLPLPLILKYCKIHMSKYSGSIIEAAQFNKMSIILEKVGNKNFQDYIINGKAIGLIFPTAPQIWENIKNN